MKANAGDTLLAKKYLDLLSKAELGSRIQNWKEEDISLEHGFPFGGKWFAEDGATSTNTSGPPAINSDRRK